MKIGILTLPLHTNYGGILQAYALQTVLERMGHEVKVIDRNICRPLPLRKMPMTYLKRMVKKYIYHKDIRVFSEQYNAKIYPLLQCNTDEFIQEYINRIFVRKLDQLSRRKMFDVIVVGSDQVWRPIYFGVDDIENAFLKFTFGQDIKRIAYAPSFGVDTWEYTKQQTKKCKKLLKRFDAISVREKSGVSLCKSHFEVEPEWVLDPTMLLTNVDYEYFFKNANIPVSKGSLLVYILDEIKEKKTIIEKLASLYHLIPFGVGSKVEDDKAPIEERIQPPVEEWLRGFYDAKYVVTDSFHACVFSIIFKKQFIVVANKKRGISRLESLLGMLGLNDRIVNECTSFSDLQTIDYDTVYQKYEILRKNSIDFLMRALK